VSQAEAAMKDVLEFYERETDGWCTPDKAIKIIEICLQPDVNRCVEIGVFTGRSLIPAAIALKQKGSRDHPFGRVFGTIMGIDPYDAKTQVDGFETYPEHFKWGLNVPWNEFHKRTLDHIERLGLSHHCGLVRMASADASGFFPRESLDYVHIDGNHSAARSYEDAVLWYDRLRVGGYLIFDDVNWETTQAAVHFLDTRCETVFKSSPDWWTIYRRNRP
jgi:hypothetical protein